jgi:hypothetical protein
MIPVDWDERTRDRLADIYVAATPHEREIIAIEIERLERALQRDPLEVGESRVPFIRVVSCGPLVIWFQVNAEATKVRVFHVTRPEHD